MDKTDYVTKIDINLFLHDNFQIKKFLFENLKNIIEKREKKMLRVRMVLNS